MSAMIKYRVHEVGKDFGRTSKEITQILTDYGARRHPRLFRRLSESMLTALQVLKHILHYRNGSIRSSDSNSG